MQDATASTHPTSRRPRGGKTATIKGGRLTKWKGEVASLSPMLGSLTGSISRLAVITALAAGGLTLSSGGAMAGCVEDPPGFWTCDGVPDDADGISVTNFAGALSITATGDAAGLDRGIRAYNDFAGTDLTISAVDVTGGDFGVYALNYGSGALSITTTGDVTGTNGTGIYAYNGAAGTDLTINAVNVSGGDFGVYAYNEGLGALSITTTGDVIGGTYTGIFAFNRGTALTISAFNVSGGRDGIYALNYRSGALSITTTGDVTGTNGDGIYARNSGTDLTISAVDVTGGDFGVYALNAGSGALSITTTGDVTGGDFGIFARNDGTDLTISAFNVTGGYRGISALNEGLGALSITTTGDVTGTTSTGISARNFGTDLTISAFNVSGGLDGVFALNEGLGALSITTTGDVIGGTGRGIYAENYGTDLTINAVNVTGGNRGIDALNYGSGALSITTTGDVIGTNGDGIYARNDGTDLTISAFNVSGGAVGIYARNFGSGALSITTTGDVTGTNVTGIYARNQGTDLTISAVNVSGGVNGIFVLNVGIGALSITTTGDVTGTTNFGIFALSFGDATVDIAGLVTGGGGTAIDMTTVAGDATLALRSGWGLSGRALGSGTANDTLQLTGDTAATLDLAQVGDAGNPNAILNFENFVKDGSADWTLSGTQGGTGFLTAELQEGRLVLDNATFKMDAGGTFEIADGGILGGSGTVVGAVIVASGGIIAPGNSIGTLNVDGDLTFGAGSIYEVEVDGNASDLITATGTATLNGGTVVVTGNFVPLFDYQILTAAGGVMGTFAGANDSYAFLDALLAYGANDVTLRLDRNNVAFASVAATPNQKSVAGGLDSLTFGNPVYDAFVKLDVPAAQQAFDQLSGEIHASSITALIGNSGKVRSILSRRFQSAFENRQAATSFPLTSYASWGSAAEQASGSGYSAWGQVFGSWGRTSGDGNAARLRHDDGGFLVGADAIVAETWSVGAFAGYSRSTFSASDRNSSGASDNFHLGFHAGTEIGALRLNLGAAHTWHALDTSRTVAFPGFTDRLSASYNARTAQIFGEAAYRFDMGATGMGGLAFEPFAGLAYVHTTTDGFTETGGAAALTAAGSTTATTFSTLGLRAFSQFDMGGMQATARAMVGWRHAFGDTVPTTRLNFAGGSGFSVSGAPIARDAALVEAGLDLAVGKNVTFGLSYDGQFSERTREHGFNARLRVAF